MINTINCIIAIIVLSFIVSVLIGCYLYKVLKKEFDESVGRLEAKLPALEERFFYLEDDYRGHISKYH